MNRTRLLLISVIGLFIMSNLYLIFKKDSEIARIHYIDKWTKVKAQTLVESKNSAGVVTAAGEQHVYYQSKSGDFKQFLVEKGDEVEVGTALYEYSPDEIEQSITKLEAEKTKLETELTGIQSNITQLETLERTLASKPIPQKEEEDGGHDHDQTELMINNVKTDIYDKERQKARIQGEIQKIDSQISSAKMSLSSLTVNSDISGMIKEVRHNLKNPVITILSNDQQIDGLLREEEVKGVSEGMKVYITSNTIGETYEGTVTEIFTYPINEPDVNKESQYRYIISFNELPEEKLLNGAHVDLKIIQREAVDALTVPFHSIRKKGLDSYVLAIEANGTIGKRIVETGLHLHKIQEVTGEVQVGDLIIHDPYGLENEASFYTPLQTKHWEKKNVQEMGKKAIFKAIGKGYLSR